MNQSTFCEYETRLHSERRKDRKSYALQKERLSKNSRSGKVIKIW